MVKRIAALVFLLGFLWFPLYSIAQSAQVWVNSNSKVYHCEGARWYGKTKRGRYLDETQAVSNGYRPARGVRCSSAGRAAANEIAGNDIKVWVNSKSRVYHCPGARWYGKTKRGRFMGEGEALSSGNRPSRGQRCG